ncbi:MAG: hypothetical protein J5613_02925 [Alphaproteobacteria bacterium]|nr:hypothetical protein [Alphaproteobacteria bacterium]
MTKNKKRMTKNKKRLIRDIIIALALVLSGGITVSMVGKHKAKKKIEKNVKEVLIPQTERKIDSLVARRDSIVDFYEAEIAGLKHTEDSLTTVVEQSQIKTSQDQDGNKHIDLIGPMSDIEQLVEELHHQGVVAQTGDEMFDEFGEVYYVNQIHYRPDFEIEMPGDFHEYDPGLTLLHLAALEREGITPDEDDRSQWHKKLNFVVDDPVWFLFLMRRMCIPAMTSDEDIYSDEGILVCIADHSVEYRTDVLLTLQEFLGKLDNSQMIFNPSTLAQLDRLIKRELSQMDQMYDARAKYNKATAEYKSVKGNLDKQINAQRQRLSELQSPNIVDVMYKNQKKDKTR